MLRKTIIAVLCLFLLPFNVASHAAQKTRQDYIDKVTSIKTRLDSTWSDTDNAYSYPAATGNDWSYLNGPMLQLLAIYAGLGIATPTDLARAKALCNKAVNSAISSGTWTWRARVTYDTGYVAATPYDLPMAEGIYFCWKYRTQIGFSAGEITNIESVIKDHYIPSVYDASVATIRNNQDQAKWLFNRIGIAAIMGNAAAQADINTLAKAWIDNMSTPYGGTNDGSNSLSGLFPDFSWRYVQARSWNNFEYNAMSLGAFFEYQPELAPYLSLTTGEIDRLKAWERQVFGQWQTNGFPNWDTDFSWERIYVSEYWAWSWKFMLGVARASAWNMGTSDSGAAKALLDNAIDTYTAMSDPAWRGSNGLIDIQPFWTDASAMYGNVYGNNYATANAMIAKDIIAAVELGVTEIPATPTSNIWGWAWNPNKAVWVSTPYYSAASLPYAPNTPDIPNTNGVPDGVQRQHWGISHIQDSGNHVLTSQGGYGFESFSFRVTRNGTEEIDTSNYTSGVPSTQQVYLNGILQTRSDYDTTSYPLSFSSVRNYCQKNTSNYNIEVDTTFYNSKISSTHRATLTGNDGTGQAVLSIPAMQGVTMVYVPKSGSNMTIWDGTTTQTAPGVDQAKYIHMKWPVWHTGFIIIPTSCTVKAGAKCVSYAFSPTYTNRQGHTDRSLLIYLGDNAANMGSVDLTYDVLMTDGTDAGAATVYSSYMSGAGGSSNSGIFVKKNNQLNAASVNLRRSGVNSPAVITVKH